MSRLPASPTPRTPPLRQCSVPTSLSRPPRARSTSRVMRMSKPTDPLSPLRSAATHATLCRSRSPGEIASKAVLRPIPLSLGPGRGHAKGRLARAKRPPQPIWRSHALPVLVGCPARPRLTRPEDCVVGTSARPFSRADDTKITAPPPGVDAEKRQPNPVRGEDPDGTLVASSARWMSRLGNIAVGEDVVSGG